MSTVHARIEGRVQGVFFRDSTRRQAEKLNLTGWVQNMADGSVEAVFQGKIENVEAMKTWLGDGSPQADVSRVEIQQLDGEQQFSEFQIRY